MEEGSEEIKADIKLKKNLEGNEFSFLLDLKSDNCIRRPEINMLVVLASVISAEFNSWCVCIFIAFCKSFEKAVE